jgi:hypothetical protein
MARLTRSESSRRRPPRAARRFSRHRTGWEPISVEPPLPQLRKDHFEVRPVGGGATTIAVVRALPVAAIAIAGAAVQAMAVSILAAVITVAVAVPLLVGAVLLFKRGVKIDRLYMTPAVVGEVSPLTGKKRETSRAAVAKVVDVAVAPVAPPYFDYLLFIDSGDRCLLRIDLGNYDSTKIDEFILALAVTRVDAGLMKARAVYRRWRGSIPWILGRAGVAATLFSILLVIGMLVAIGITSPS